MRWNRFGLAMALSLVGLAAWPALGDDDEKIKLESVPALVKKAADKAVPGAKWAHASKEIENGKTIYELSGKDAKDREVEVEVTADGRVLEVETEVPLSEIPKEAMDAAMAKYPKFKATEGETVSKNGKLFAHDIEGTLNGKKMEIRVAVADNSVSIEDDDE